jgi:hypothetical protein
MKKLIALFAVVVLFSAYSFAAVNGGSPATGTSHFGATVLTPITVSSPSQVDLGEYVASAIPYVNTSFITFTVGGAPNHSFYYTTSDVTSALPTDFTYTGAWTPGPGAALPGVNGTGSIGTTNPTFTLATITCLTAGSYAINLSVTVSYNAL